MNVAKYLVLITVMLNSHAWALDIVTNSSARHQVIEGWGTALWREEANDPRYRAAYRDAGMNLVRIEMNKEVLVASPVDFATPVPLGSDLQANVDQMNFQATSNLTAQGEFAQWLKQNALEPDRVKVSASPWTPPHWMKGPTGATQNFVGVTPNHPTPFLSNMVVPWNANNPIPNGDSVGGRLKTEDPEILRQYGEYLAAWVTGFEQEYGVPIYTMSLQNESTFENPFNSMTFRVDQNGDTDYGQYAMALESVRDAWEQHGISTKVMGPHVAQVGPTPQNPWSLLSQSNYIAGVKNASDPTLIDFLDFYNSNYYMPFDEAGVQATAGYYHGKDAVTAPWVFWATAPGVKQDNKPIWYSETGGAKSNWINGSGGTVGDGAITVALKMFNTLVHSDASAYLYWQFSDGGSSVTEHNLLNGSSLNNPLSSDKYAAFNHFSRYVRPGAVRIDSTFANGKASVGGGSEHDTLNSVNVSSFLHEEDETLTYVLLNMKNSAESITIDLPDELSLDSFDIYRSSESENFVKLSDLVVQDGQLTFSLPRYSVVTLVGNITQPLSADYDQDGDVDGADFLAIQRNDPSLIPLWQAEYGTFPGTSATSSALPEPTTLMLLSMFASMFSLARF